MKQRVKRVVALSLAAVMMLMLFTGCARSEIKETISKFEAACQALDFKGMLECMNPTIAKPVLSALELFGVTDTSGLLDTLTSTLNIFSTAGDSTEEFIQSIKIKPSGYDFNDAKDECKVSAKLSYGDENEKEITVKMVMKNEAWYISSIDFSKSDS